MRHSQEPSLSVSLVQFNFGLSLSATPEAVFKDISFILFWETDVRPRMRRFLKNPLCESQPCIPLPVLVKYSGGSFYVLNDSSLNYYNGLGNHSLSLSLSIPLSLATSAPSLSLSLSLPTLSVTKYPQAVCLNRWIGHHQQDRYVSNAHGDQLFVDDFLTQRTQV